MKREIKFKGKRVDGGGWVYGMPTHDLKYIFNSDSTDSPDRYEVDPDTVGQFTGRKDKNGKEIYEGDIINRAYYTQPGKVIWSDEFACFAVVTIDEIVKDEVVYYFDGAEIIGNLHDNPELLKEESNG